MRSAVFALLLCHAVAASAQITIGEEVVSDPLRNRIVPLSFAAPAVAIAKDRAGAAVAWTMANGTGADAADRIYVARLGPTGQAGIVREVPLSAAGAAVHQASPSLAPAPGGDGFVLAWFEIEQFTPSRARPLIAHLDAALTASTPTVLFPVALPSVPIIVRTKGDTSWISISGFLWSLSKDGTVSGPLTSIATATDMTIATDLPQLIGSHTALGPKIVCRGVCLPPVPPVIPLYSLDFVSLLTTSVEKTFKFTSNARPAIGNNGQDVLVAWFQGTQTDGGDVVALRLGAGDFTRFLDLAAQPAVLARFPADSGETRPDIAADGERYLVVWREARTPPEHDIAGVAIDNDGKVTPLSIATSSADERDPAIVALGGGTFLVAYEKSTGIERRIAGRFIRFGRHRAAR